MWLSDADLCAGSQPEANYSRELADFIIYVVSPAMLDGPARRFD